MSANKEGKKPQYKDYVNFLDAYKNGKKDDSACHSLTNSSNNSSTSINSDYLNEQPTKGFKEYLENYENRKFSSVKPTFLKKNPQPDSKKIVKTEIFININNDQTSANNTYKASENLNGISSNNNNSVNKVTKIFEKNSNNERITKTVSSKVNEYNSQQSETETDGSEQKKISVEEISKKFQTKSENNGNAFESKRTTLKKQDSIKEMSKIFENNRNEVSDKKQPPKIQIIRQNSFKENSQIFGQPENCSLSKPTAPLPPKPPVIKIEPAQKNSTHGIGNGINDTISSTCISNGKNESMRNLIKDSLQRSMSPPNNLSSPTNIPPPPPPPLLNLSKNTRSGNFPPTPPLSPIQNKGIKISSMNSNNTTESLSASTAPSPPAVKTVLTNGTTSIPIPPPPPPPSNFSTKVTYTNSLTRNTNSNNGIKHNVTGYSTLPRVQNNKPKDGGDAIAVPSLDKNDPRVKKLVYGALRDLYGAYHDQANNYLATLPKNRVRKNNGLDSIINSIASQGGLDKLSGRANPNTETELANH